MTTKSEIRQQLRDSLDMVVLRRDLLLVCLTVVLCLLWMGIFGGGFRNPEFWIIATVLSGIIILPVLIYSICVAVRIFRSTGSYTLHHCKLIQPHHQKWGRGAMYFTVLLEDPDGKFVVNTRPIFASYGIAGPLLEDYLNKTVTIAYNQETEMVVVIG